MTEPIYYQMTYCTIVRADDWITTHFLDGTSYGAFPHDTPEYKALAKRCGYKGSIYRYCHEHEIAHSYIAQELYKGPSRVIWGCAHGQYAKRLDIVHEEELVISLQAFARADILPGSSAPDFSWFKLRDGFLKLLGDG